MVFEAREKRKKIYAGQQPLFLFFLALGTR
jgi:hypothetical protein